MAADLDSYSQSRQCLCLGWRCPRC